MQYLTPLSLFFIIVILFILLGVARIDRAMSKLAENDALCDCAYCRELRDRENPNGPVDHTINCRCPTCQHDREPWA